MSNSKYVCGNSGLTEFDTLCPGRVAYINARVQDMFRPAMYDADVRFIVPNPSVLDTNPDIYRIDHIGHWGCIALPHHPEAARGMYANGTCTNHHDTAVASVIVARLLQS